MRKVPSISGYGQRNRKQKSQKCNLDKLATQSTQDVKEDLKQKSQKCNLDKLTTQSTQDVREDRKQKSQKCNLDKLTTQSTQDVRENRKQISQKCNLNNWQHRVHKTMKIKQRQNTICVGHHYA